MPLWTRSIPLVLVVRSNVFAAILAAFLADVQRWQDHPVKNVVHVQCDFGFSFRLEHRAGCRIAALRRYASRVPTSFGITGTGALETRVLGSLIWPSQTDCVTRSSLPSWFSHSRPASSDRRKRVYAATATMVTAGCGKCILTNLISFAPQFVAQQYHRING